MQKSESLNLRSNFQGISEISNVRKWLRIFFRLFTGYQALSEILPICPQLARVSDGLLCIFGRNGCTILFLVVTYEFEAPFQPTAIRGTVKQTSLIVRKTLTTHIGFLDLSVKPQDI